MDNVRFLLQYSKASSHDFFVGIAGKMFTELLSVIVWAMVFGFLYAQDAPQLIWLLCISGAVVTLQWFSGQSTKQSFLGAYDITHHLRSQLLSDIRKQPLAHLIGKGLGERMKLVTTDLKLFEDIFSHLVADFFAAWVIPACMLVFMLWVSPTLAAVLALFIALAILVLVMAEGRLSRMAKDNHEHTTQSANQVLEFIACLPMLKSFGRSERLSVPLKQRIEQVRQSGLGLEWAGGTGVMGATLILELSLPAMIVVSSTLYGYGAITLTDCLAAILATIATVRPLARLALFSTLLRLFISSARRLRELASSPQQTQKGQAPNHYDISLEKVSLTFEEQTVLNRIDLTISQGEHVAIVGPSGSGKSSLLHLIAAFHNPTHGQIKIGGKTLEKIGTEQLYKHISYVTQEVQLFAGSLKDNLLIANNDASLAQLQEAVTNAGLQELLQRLPQGLDSEIGENGCQLSGGERQRLSLARALLHNAPIVLLDEFTSALDQVKQQEVLDTLEQLCKGKTVVTVAHRLDTVTDADTIYLLNQGQIVANGNHNELLNSNSQYQELWYAGRVA